MPDEQLRELTADDAAGRGGRAAAEKDRHEWERRLGDRAFEVMVDTWGTDELYTRGDIVTQADCPYDLAWAERLGVVRPADMVGGRPVTTGGLPVLADGSIDYAVQAGVAYASGAVDPANDLRLVEDELAAMDDRRAFLEQRRDTLREQVDREERRRKRMAELRPVAVASPPASPAPGQQVGSPQQPGVHAPAVPGHPSATSAEMQERAADERRETERRAAERRPAERRSENK